MRGEPLTPEICDRPIPDSARRFVRGLRGRLHLASLTGKPRSLSSSWKLADHVDRRCEGVARPEERDNYPEVRSFRDLQGRLPQVFQSFSTPEALRTVLIVPSLSLDQEVLAKISGVHHYEERMLCLLLLLRLPRTRVIYVSSQPIPEPIIDYYLHLLPGIPAQHAKGRLTLLSCYDGSPVALTAKMLVRPRLLQGVGAWMRVSRQDWPRPAGGSGNANGNRLR